MQIKAKLAYNYSMSEQKEKKPEVEEEWDKKKIIAVTILALVLCLAAYSLLGPMLGLNKNTVLPNNAPQVKGASTQINLRQNVQNQIDAIKKEADNIDLAQVASSSPQVQKIIRDLKAIQNYPSNQLKSTCLNICNGL